MLATMCPDIVFARLPVILTCGIVTALLGFILIKIEFHSHPLSVGSHAKKGIGYPMRVLISIVPSYTTGSLQRRISMPIMPKRSGVPCAANVPPFAARPTCMPKQPQDCRGCYGCTGWCTISFVFILPPEKFPQSL